MSSSSSSVISLAISHGGTHYSLSMLPDSTLHALKSRLEELTSVPPEAQKLLYRSSRKPKPSQADSDAVTLKEAGMKEGTKIQLLGPTATELGRLKVENDERCRREEIIKQRMAKGPTKVRSTGPPASASSTNSTFRFHRIEPLAHLPNPASARALLSRLSDDPAIRHIMQQHQFAVGLLTELAPHEQPQLLGLNVNVGQAIKLRLRTDAYDGFRTYNEVRRVLCHELAHNIFSDHDNGFKELNSQLNREVAEFELALRQGTHHLGTGDGDVYEPASELEAEAHVHVLGGGVANSVTDESREVRRQRVLEATMNRLRKEEEELEHSCGNAGPAASI